MLIELQKGGLRAVTDTHGGELISLRDAAGTEYIWGGDPAFWPGRNPNLFPIVGNLKDGTVRFDGEPFRMGRHGFARNSEFSPAEQAADAVTFLLEDSEETRAQYPFRFALQVRHRLLEDGFATSFTVENRDDKTMPFCVGGHTAFRCPLYPEERFEDYDIALDRPEDTPMLLLNGQGNIRHGASEDVLHGTGVIPLDHALFDRVDTVIFDRPQSCGVSLRHREGGHGVHLDFTGFPMVAFWTKTGCAAPYICLEPWHGCAALDDESGEFRDKPHCILLEPGGRRTLTYTVTLRPRNS